VNKLNVIFTNADSLMNKRTDLEVFISQQLHKPDIIGIVEVKPKNGKDLPQLSEFSLKGYDIHYVNVDTVYGRGVILYTASWLNASPYTAVDSGVESLWVTLRLSGRDRLIIGCIYRSPSSSAENDSKINNKMKSVCASGDASHILIMGDFNYPNINWDTVSSATSSAEKLFIDAVNDSYLFQHVSSPTRARGNQCPSILDLIFTNEEGMVSSLLLLAPLGKSDHGLLSFQLHCYMDKTSSIEWRRNYNKGDYEKLRNELRTDWNSLLDPLHDNAEAQFTVLQEKLEAASDRCIPYIESMAEKKWCRPPIDKDTRKLIRHKNRLWTRYMETRDTAKYNEYCKCRNKVRAITRKLRKEFELQVARKSREEPKNFWNYANSKLKTRHRIPDLYMNMDNKQLTISDHEKVQVLSDFFASVYTDKSNNSLPDMPYHDVQHEMCMPDINSELIEKLLTELKSSKSPGPDGVHPRVLKELASELAIPLTKIFKSVMETGRIPQSWKIAHISPIFKKGDKRDPSNYRPVSLTCIVSKILEKIIRDCLMDHLRLNNFVSNKQFGFLRGRSANLQMIRVMDDWTKCMDQGMTVDVIYMDFMKAFDKVPHDHLLHKLQNLGIHHKILLWLRDFLKDRSQVVSYNNCMSSSVEVRSGVPQGTVVGPSSFLTFVNDLPDEVSSLIYMFADDTKLYKGISTNTDRQQLQSDIDKLVMWSTRWRLLFNLDKCKVMTLGHPSDVFDYTMTQYDGKLINVQRTHLERDLGIMIDSELNFSEHIHMVSKKANGIVAVIRRTFTSLDCQCFNLLYKSLVRTHLEYGVTTWFPYKIKDIETIEKIQKRATKQVKQIRHLSYSERLRKLNLPTLRYRRHRGDMIEVFKILHNIYDKEVTEGILNLSTNTSTRGHSLKLSTQRSRLELRRNSFAVRVVKPWNSLSEEVVTSTSVRMFEARLDKMWNNQPMKFNYKEELCL